MSRQAKDLMSAITQSQQSIRSASQRCMGAASRRAHSAVALASVITMAPGISESTLSEPPPAPDTTTESAPTPSKPAPSKG